MSTDNQKASVQRQLNLYGFKCINRGEDKGSFFHPQFKRGEWETVKKITRFVPSAKKIDADEPTNEQAKEKKVMIEVVPNPAPAPKTTANDSPARNHHTVQEMPQVSDPFLNPYEHFAAFSHQHAPIHYPMDGFTYPEHGYHHAMGIQSAPEFWNHWLYSQEGGPYPFMNRAPSEIDFSHFAVDFDGASLAPMPEATSVIAVPKVKSEPVQVANNVKKPLVFTAPNNSVFINPDFDIEDEFGLFQDFSIVESMPVPAVAPLPSKPKMVDACVNTDLTQSTNSIYQLYRYCHPL